MVVVDVHTHVFLKKHWPDNLTEGVADQYAVGLGLKREDIIKGPLIQDMFDSNPDKLVKEMNEAGIDRSVVFGIDFWKDAIPSLRLATSADEWNKYVLDAVNKYPDKLVGFIAVDPRRKNASEIIDRGLREWNMKGIKIYPPTGFYPSDEVCTPLYKKALDYGVPVLSHTGPVAGPFFSECTRPIYLDEVAGKFPELKIIIAHAGWGAWLDEVISILVTRPRVYTDISAWGPVFHHHDQAYLVASLRKLINVAPARILFGSDWGLTKTVLSLKEWVKWLKEYQVPEAMRAVGIRNFTPRERNDLLGENARKLLKI
jgi:hypothetical protein